MQDKTTLNYIKLFLIVIIICSIVSLVIKGVSLVKNASFKEGSFNILFLDQNAYIVHVAAGENTINVLKIDKARSILLGKTRLAQSLVLGKFIDASITSSDEQSFDGIEKNFISLGRFLTLAANASKYKRDNLNNYDLLKIYIDSKMTPNSNREFREINKMSKDGLVDDNMNLFEFSDPDIFNGKISVQVLNGTNINGFATNVGKVLQSLGYNVVETSSTSKSVSSIESTALTPEVHRISTFLNLPVKISTEEGIADIKLILGEDIVKKNKL